VKKWKRWKKWTLAAVGVLALTVVVCALWWRSTIDILMGTEDLTGLQEAIPSSVPTTLPALTRGEADWLCWRGAKGDGRSTVTGIRTDWAGGLKKLWEVNFLCQGAGSAAWSAPVIRGNRLVVTGRGDGEDLVFCLDPADGRLLWKKSYKAKAGPSHGSGPRATPWIDGDRVYTFGRGGDLACRRLLDGELVWRRNVGDQGGKAPTWGHSSSPLVTGERVVVQGGGKARLIAYDKHSGEVAWTSGEGLAGYAAPAVMDIEGAPAILAFHGEGLSAVAAETGEQLWNVPWETDFDVQATTPIVIGQTVFISSGYETGGALLRVEKAKATTVWRSKAIASIHSDPYVIGGHLYGYSGQSYQNKGAFKCVALETGREKWSTGRMGWGTCVWVDGYLLCCDIRGNLFLMTPQPEALKLVAEMPDALGDIKGPVWTLPVVANGRLYLRFRQQLVCYDLMPP